MEDRTLHEALYAISRTSPDSFKSSDILMNRIPNASALTYCYPFPEFQNPTVETLDGYVARLLFIAEAYGLRAWGSRVWDVMEDLIEHHRREFWQEREIARYGGPEDRQRERRANRKRNHRIPVDLRHTIYERDGWKCCDCGKKTDLTIDHTTPIAEGGVTEYTISVHYAGPAIPRAEGR